MTKAAEKLMISQPAVSKSIKTLEDQLGVSLFNRSSKGLELTSEGKMIYDLKDLRSLLKSLAKDENIGILISSHNLAELESFCSNVCIIQNVCLYI